MTDCVIRSRINNHIKTKAVQLFGHMGLTLSEAIRLFLYQSVAEKRIPFEISIPNADTCDAFEEVKCGRNLEKTSISQLAKDWKGACGK
ncbi:MAG: type II toxin-antitoxin system RelB/DinJ family antitoxin [bacterium]